MPKPNYDFANFRRSNKHAAIWLAGLLAFFIIGFSIVNHFSSPKSINQTTTDNIEQQPYLEEVLEKSDSQEITPIPNKENLQEISKLTQTLDLDLKINELTAISFKNSSPETIISKLRQITTEDYLDELKSIQF